MAKQKFCCKGVLRATGQRASIVIAADSQAAAVRIATENGIAVEQTMPVADPVPQPPSVVDKDDVVDRIDDILSAEDDDLDDFDLDDEAGDASPDRPSTKSCPYCGEQILAVAVKCKHCGSYVGKTVSTARRPTGDATSPDVPSRLAAMPTWAKIVAGTVGVVLILILLAFIIRMLLGTAAPVLPVPLAAPSLPPAPSAPAVPVKPAPSKPLAEEIAFAAKLSAFLDSCDEMARLLDKAPKVDQYTKQCEVLKTRFAAIPPPPQGVPWAEEAAASGKRAVDMMNMVTYSMTTLDAAMQALGQSASDSPEARAAYRDAAEKMRQVPATIRGLIPPACLAKPE